MVEKESADKIRRIFGLRTWRSRWSRSLTQKHFLSPKREKIAKVLLLLGLSLFLTLLLIPSTYKSLPNYQVGDIAQESVKATGEFLVEDAETTAQRQRDLLAQIPPVFDLEEQFADKVQQRLHDALEFMRGFFQEASQPGGRGSVPAKG